MICETRRLYLIETLTFIPDLRALTVARHRRGLGERPGTADVETNWF